MKSLNLRLELTHSFNTHPIIIKYKGKVVEHVDLNITQKDQKEEIICIQARSVIYLLDNNRRNKWQ